MRAGDGNNGLVFQYLTWVLTYTYMMYLRYFSYCEFLGKNNLGQNASSS